MHVHAAAVCLGTAMHAHTDAAGARLYGCMCMSAVARVRCRVSV